MTVLLGAARFRRVEDRRGHRNGFYERDLATQIGIMDGDPGAAGPGGPVETEVARALRELGVQLLSQSARQYPGNIERFFRFLQEPLLDHNQAGSMEELQDLGRLLPIPPRRPVVVPGGLSASSGWHSWHRSPSPGAAGERNPDGAWSPR